MLRKHFEMNIALAALSMCAAIMFLGPTIHAQTSPNPTGGGPFTQAHLGSPTAQSGSPTGATAAVATSDTFEGFVRYPAEEQTFQSIGTQNAVAYFRDFFAGGETFSSGANDGDTLSAQASGPNFSNSWTPITFHSTYNGQQNCWVGGFPPVTLCGSTDIDIIWYFNVQCGPSGVYTMSFLRNSATFAMGNFTLTPTIAPDKVAAFTAPIYDQTSYPTVQYGNFCWIPDPNDTTKKKTVLCSSVTTPNPPQAFVSQLGCLLTSYASTLTYHGVPTSPTDLNTWLTSNAGYDAEGNIRPGRVVKYAHDHGVNLMFQRQPANGDTLLDGGALAGIARTAVCSKGPTALRVKHRRDANGNPTRKHFVTAWGRTQTEDTYLLKDPDKGIDDVLNSKTGPLYDYNNQYFGTRELQGTGVTFTFPGIAAFTLHSPAELLLTDSSGRRTGIDPTTNTSFAEIPNAAYGDDSVDDPTDDTDSPVNIQAKTLEVSPLPAGTYKLTVTGTGTGTYDLEFQSDDPNFQTAQTAINGMPVSPGSVQIYSITSPIPSGGAFPLSGGFDGGGGHDGVNDFLTYANPTTSETDPPAGTTSFPLLIFYDPAVIANTFTATLQGADISSQFHPTPGGFEVVNIPLVSGSNVLIVGISGTFSGHVSTDKDRLTFVVP